ncbi:hypothetical protein SEA_LASTRESORT_42 [Gordonia phage LastResort]|uniref:hypothetical protein n=1 Tax=Gordonia phage Rosalind TaxID=1838077 RepID=UPI0007B653C5|nr:hypothetical protein BEN61_gp069 [Gordonia phage Rosalind]AXH47840.1 hypothetical protein SEA_LASTRESORT_42 [Gordonia phage LastResort]QDM56218.1 hypothetical protein SEA_REMO_42 [Gordonia phage ReMo]QLF84915.1 hypothetical protein SEA_EPSOCAMISIO_42 [Gordonia phage Epsocamisio]QZD98691.1 hypothetical protein SEA_LOOPER_43 [Gordonia phage Looper]WKW87355.1 hypothetical protein SEA_NEBULOSUS_42 [Gordonia phage Nebulosus]
MPEAIGTATIKVEFDMTEFDRQIEYMKQRLTEIHERFPQRAITGFGGDARVEYNAEGFALLTLDPKPVQMPVRPQEF